MWVWLKFNNSLSLNGVNGKKKKKRWTYLGEALCCVPEEAERSGQRALQLLGHHCGGQKLRVTTVTCALTSLALAPPLELPVAPPPAPPLAPASPQSSDSMSFSCVRAAISWFSPISLLILKHSATMLCFSLSPGRQRFR